MYPRLANVKAHLSENYSDETFGLDAAARIAGLEKTYFCKYFRAKVGISFSCWLARTRINRSLLLLASEDLNVSELAYAVGFGDVRTFQRAFKKFTGVTPRSCTKALRDQQSASRSLDEVRWEEILPALFEPVDCSEYEDRLEDVDGAPADLCDPEVVVSLTYGDAE